MLQRASGVDKLSLSIAARLPLSLPRMRIALTDYSTLNEVLRAVEEMPYEGGGSRTGEALDFLAESVFAPSIARDNTPKVNVQFYQANTNRPLNVLFL